MERTTTANIANPSRRWKKIGGGSFRLGNRRIKPGQKFSATLAEIPEQFRDVCVLLDGSPAKNVPIPVITAVETEYKTKPRGKGGWYDVVDSKGKVINEKALKKEIAEKLVEDLAK